MTKAYIPLWRKTTDVGALRWVSPPTRNFALARPTCWYLKTLKFAVPPMSTRNAGEWNIVCIGSPTQYLCVGHVNFIFLVSISFALGPVFQWNMGSMVKPNRSWHNVLRWYFLHSSITAVTQPEGYNIIVFLKLRPEFCILTFFQYKKNCVWELDFKSWISYASIRRWFQV